MIITATDTFYVTFIIPVTGPNYPMLQEGVRYLDNFDNECRINPEDAKEIRFEHKGKLIRMVSQFDKGLIDSDTTAKKFVYLVSDGQLKLFKPYRKVYNGSVAGQYQPYYLLQMEDEKPQYYGNSYFKKLPDTLKKCPVLVKMINEKVY